ncbi:MAG TPA: GAF domain-containing protein [Terriglobales bacterium]|nr:GAF domain-containing protein [Terriglobales bacterium]
MAERVPIWYDVEQARAHQSSAKPYPAGAFAHIADQLKDALNLSGVAIALESEEDSKIVCIASCGESAPPLGTVLDVSSGICALCVRQNRTLISNDAGSDPRVSRETCEALGIRSLLVSPLQIESRCVGLVLAISEVINRFNAETENRIHKQTTRAAALLLRSGDKPARQVTPITEMSGLRMRHHRGMLPVLFVVLMIFSVALLASHALRHPKSAVRTSRATTTDAASSTQPYGQRSYEPQAEDELRVASPGLLERAQAGEVRAQLVLAHRYFTGDGVARDRIKASVWYIIAGANGDQRAKESAALITRALPSSEIAQIRFNVGKMYMDGIGTRRDLGEAYSWFALAQAAGDVRAATEQQRLEQMMTPKQVSEALQRASDWILSREYGNHVVPTVIADSSRSR